MTQALLLVGHGSRVAEGNAQFLDLAQMVRASAGARPVEHCFIELAKPDVAAGLDACVRRGGDQVVVLPIMLFAANHAKVEIPAYLEEARRRYPHVTFRYGRPLGVDSLMMGILRDRFADVAAAPSSFDRASVAVVLVGRGSSDSDANSDLAKVGRMFLEQEGVALVDVCYAGVTRPDLLTVVRRLARLDVERVVVLPYFLFTGVLVHRIEGWVRDLQAEFPALSIQLGPHLSGHPNLVKLILAREQEALVGNARMNCDSCKLRLLAPQLLDRSV